MVLVSRSARRLQLCMRLIRNVPAALPTYFPRIAELGLSCARSGDGCEARDGGAYTIASPLLSAWRTGSCEEGLRDTCIAPFRSLAASADRHSCAAQPRVSLTPHD
jgi:hypothetical protein